MDDFTHNLSIDVARRRTISGREEAAQAFFKDAWGKLLEAQKLGFWHYQLRQEQPVSFHETKAALAFRRQLHHLGLGTEWVGRTFQPDDSANPFGEHAFIYELRVWWHRGIEVIRDFSVDKPLEGSEAQDITER